MVIWFRPLGRDDFPQLADWLARPHVHKWWKEPFDLAAIEEKYEPRVDDADPTDLYLVEADGVAIGMLQSYWVDDYAESGHASAMGFPGSVGVDLFIGEENYIGKGYGPAMLRAFLSDLLPVRYPGATGVVTDPDAANLA